MNRRFNRLLPISFFVLAAGLVSAQDKSGPVNSAFQDVQPTGPNAVFFPYIQIAKNVGLAVPSFLGACVAGLPAGANPPPPAPGRSIVSACVPLFRTRRLHHPRRSRLLDREIAVR
jgi:hypothetical protein